MLNHSRLTILATVLCLPATAALAAGPEDSKTAAASVHAGQDIFNANCTVCHSTEPNQVRVGPSLHGELQKPNPKKTDAEVRQILKSGKGMMPSFDGKLKPEEIDNLLAYLHTL